MSQYVNIARMGLGDPESPQTFTTKAPAVAIAKSRGWQAKDLIRAANRFQVFWCVGQVVGPGRYRLLCNDGAFRDMDLDFRSEVTDRLRPKGRPL